MRDKHGLTPRQSVVGFVCDTLKQHVTQLPPNTSNTPAFNREWNKQAAKLHNKLLNDSGMDGTLMNEEKA